MSRGEESDEPTTGGDPAAAGPPGELGGPESAERAPEPVARFAVVISGDGSAAIDGEPVPAAGTTVDAAILDALHGHARDLGTTVTASISDPSAGYVAFVEVGPDGSSSLLDQREQPAPEPPAGPAAAPPLPPDALTGPDGADGTGDLAAPPAAAPDLPAEDPGHRPGEDAHPGPGTPPPAPAPAGPDDADPYADGAPSGDAGAPAGTGPVAPAGPAEPAPAGPPAPALPVPDTDPYADAHPDPYPTGDDDRDTPHHEHDPYPTGDDDRDGPYHEHAEPGRYAEHGSHREEDDPGPYAYGPQAPGSLGGPDEDAPDPGDGADARTAAGFGAGAAAASAPNLVRRPGARQSDDEYQGPGLLHRPLVVGPVALVVAALVIVPLVVLGSGGSDDGGHRKEAARSSSETSASPRAERSGPISTSSPSLPPPPSPSSSPSARPKKSKDAERTAGATDPRSGGGVTVTVTARPPQATVTAKPPQDTAATAVKQLAKADPSGRHICYRAYVSGLGWQKPACDGTMAGTIGRNRAIKALNIAVTGGKGSAANAFVHNPDSKDGKGRWLPSWTAIVPDGRNNYIGSSKKGAPNMSGFAINIGSGRICQMAKVHSYDWGGQGCADARPGYVFGGALENDRYLEAVKFTI